MDEKIKGTQKDSKNSADISSDQTDGKTNSASTSPNNNNNSELSNSGSSISNVSSAENNEALQDLNCNEKSTKRKSNCSNTSKEDGGISDKTKGLLGTSNVCPLTTKEDPAILANVKKEENSLSPMSPVGFDSIPNPELNAGFSASTAKITDLSGHTPKNSSNEKSSSPGNSVSCKDEVTSVTNSAGNTGNNTNCGNLNNIGLHQQPPFGGNGTASSISNCLEYMQQQNHIFVFSTHLANKSAESVLSGQFQTIISYHCTQPSTKSFLEEFFMKNPMKMSKLPRNMLSMAHGSNNQWVSSGHAVGSASNSCNIPKVGPKATNSNKGLNFNLLNANVDQKTTGRSVSASTNVTGFLEGNENEADLIHCWENNRNVNPSDIKIGENVEHPHLATKNGSLESKLGLVGNDQIPSLQGVKVPDENLTPQQRQHREEQLAKLKKMTQFLFPENDAAQTTQQINKIANDNGTSNMNNLMMNLAGPPSNVSGLNQMNSALRNNMIQNPKQASSNACENESLPGLGTAGEQLNSENMVLQGKTANLNCEPLNSNMLNMNIPCGPQPTSMLMNNINDTSMASNGTFNQCGSGDEKITTNAASLGCPQDIGPMDWPKLQNQYMDERLKGSKPLNEIGVNRLNMNSTGMCTNVRPTLTPTTGGNNVQRSGQGPPPPYHSTQRSASVPIATQSPNPSSPNNPTSNLSLPSPASASGSAPSGATITTNSPNVEMGNVPNVSCSPANSASATHANSAAQLNKGGFPQERTSPLNNNNTNRNRNSHNQLNSNPSTPLSHMSPKDLEAFNSNNAPDLQQSSIDGRFQSASQSFNFPPHIQNTSGNVNNFKAQLERQNSAPGPNPPFGRRTENMPLNPNSSRTPQNKLGGAQFDPISSLAQMSQQLTSCVSSGVGNSPSNVSCNELNMPSNIGLSHHNMDGMLQNMESNMLEAGNIPNLPSQISGTGSGIFGPNNCNMNAIMMGSMNPQHRLMNPKMCGNTGPPSGFNNPGNNTNPGNFHGVLPPNHHHRLRMPGGMNFNNFNVSPNIQVKASTPNTIQYMPVRPQNNNNMRAPPSLDFLQRFANPSQMSGVVGPNVDGHAGSHLGQINPVGVQGAPDSNKMVNNLNSGSGISAPGMNFFQHCNQMEADDMAGGNGLLPTGNHDINVGMIRGLRPMMRQHNMGPGGSNAPQRMMAPNNGGSLMQYPGSQPPTQDALECGDMTNLFGSSNHSNNPSQLFHISGGTHKTGKPGLVMGSGVGGGGGGLCSNLGGNNSSGLLPHEHNGMPSPIGQGGMIGSPMISNASGNGPQLPLVAPGPNANNMNYKPFVGPASNDLKYAQQYHSFQQQLYATSTRSQQQNGSNITSVAPNVQNSNAPFFVNK